MTASSFQEDRDAWDRYQRDHQQCAEFLANLMKPKPGDRVAPFGVLDHDVIDVAFAVDTPPPAVP